MKHSFNPTGKRTCWKRRVSLWCTPGVFLRCRLEWACSHSASSGSHYFILQSGGQRRHFSFFIYSSLCSSGEDILFISGAATMRERKRSSSATGSKTRSVCHKVSLFHSKCFIADYWLDADGPACDRLTVEGGAQLVSHSSWILNSCGKPEQPLPVPTQLTTKVLEWQRVLGLDVIFHV